MSLPFRDPALPTLPLLLDPDAIAPLLARSLRPPARLEAVRIARVAYKPGERLTVHYQATVDGHAEDAVARAVAGRDLAAKARHPRQQALARQIDGRAPATPPLRYDRDADALLSWLPYDPRLPALAQTPHQLAARLHHAGITLTHPPTEPRRLSYKPGRRIVLRLGEHVLKAYAAAWQYAAAAHGLRAAGRTPLATPRWQGVLPALRLTAQAAVEGTRPLSSLETAAEAGALLADLQRAEAPGLEPVGQERQLAAATRKAALIGAVVPALHGRVEALARRLRKTMPPAPDAVPAHGDFHRAQLLRAHGSLLVLDVDAMCLGAPALDPAEYVAGAIDGVGAGLETVHAVLDALLAGYGPRPPRLDWHLASAIVVRASHPFHRQVKRWPERVESMVEIAETILADGGTR